MERYLPLFITLFLSIFHILGGGAVGQGLRSGQSRSNRTFYFLWGGMMGLVPLIFDWFFLIEEGHLIYGLVGPMLFILTALGSVFLELNMDGPAIISTGVGTVAFLLGLAAIPIFLNVARTEHLLEDYFFGCVWVGMFVVAGGSFAWSGLSAMLHGRTLDEEMQERQKKLDRGIRNNKD